MGIKAKVGINQIGLCKIGTLLTTPTNIINLGLRPAATLNVDPFETSKDFRDRELRNRSNFKISAKTHQPTLKALMDIISTYYGDGGADVELKSVPQSSGADGGCFQFNGTTNYMGVDFEYLLTSKERTLGLTLEYAPTFLEAKAIIDASDSNTPASLGSDYGINLSLQRYPWLASISDGVDTYNLDELVDYSMSIKPMGDRDLNNRIIPDYISFMIEITTRRSRISDVVASMAGSLMPSLTIQHDTSLSSATYEKFTFAAYALSKMQAVNIGDEKRFMKLTFAGKVPLGNISSSFLVGAGGGTSADGTEGGTITIAA